MRLVDPDLLPLVDEVRAENAAMAARAAEEFASSFDPGADFVARIRSMMEPGGIFGQEPVDAAVERTVPGPAGDIPVRVFVPPTVEAVYLSIHGGAFMMGSRRSNDQTNWQIAQRCRVAVVSPEYRMAPEHEWPTGHDDCEAVALWILEHGRAELGAGSDRLLVGGESAGAHIAAVTVLRLRDRHDAMGHVAGANLNCGVYDLTGTPSRVLPPPENDVLAVAGGGGGGGGSSAAGGYFGSVVPEALRAPEPSPLYADLHDLCPAFFTVGTADSLLDDSVFMAARWSLAGNDTELAVYPYGPHGVTGSPTEMGRRAQAAVEDFLRARSTA